MMTYEPDGFVLYRTNGERNNVIRGDLIPIDTLVIEEDGRYFINTGEKSGDFSGDWRLYKEGFKLFSYKSWD